MRGWLLPRDRKSDFHPYNQPRADPEVKAVSRNIACPSKDWLEVLGPVEPDFDLNGYCNDDLPEVLAIYYALFSPLRCEPHGDRQVLWSNQRRLTMRVDPTCSRGALPRLRLQFRLKTDSGSGFGLPNS